MVVTGLIHRIEPTRLYCLCQVNIQQIDYD